MADNISRDEIVRGSDANERVRLSAGITALDNVGYLTDMSVGYSQNMFIADIVAPRIRVDKEQGTYWKWGRDAFRSEKKTGDTQVGLLRALRSESQTFDAVASTGSYECEEYAINFFIDQREIATSANPEVAKTLMVNQALSLDREVRVASLLGSGSNLTNNTTLSGTSQWSDTTSGVSDPIGDIETGIDTVRKNSGTFPNVAFMNYEVYIKLRRHPDVLAMFKVQQGAVSDAALTELIFGGNGGRLAVGSAIYDNSNEGATYSGASVWPKCFGLMYVPPTPDILVPATCYQVYTRDRTVVTAEVPTKHSRWYEVSEIQDEIIPTDEAAYLIIDAVA